MTSAASVDTGLRVERIPGRPTHQDDTGRIALPLWILRDGRHLGDTALTMSQAEAAALHAELGTQLGVDAGEGAR